MSKAIRNDRWCIVTGQDFREKFIVGDPTDPDLFTDNPNFDPSKPISPTNPKQLPPPKDLNNFTAKMDIRTKPGLSQGELIIQLSTGSGITLGSPDPVDGTVEIFIDNLVTKVSPILDAAGTIAFYDFFLIAPIPKDNIQLLIGEIKIVESITDV